MRCLVKKDSIADALAVEIAFTPAELAAIASMVPTGKEPSLKVDGRPPSEVLKELAQWCALLERIVVVPSAQLIEMASWRD